MGDSLDDYYLNEALDEGDPPMPKTNVAELALRELDQNCQCRICLIARYTLDSLAVVRAARAIDVYGEADLTDTGLMEELESALAALDEYDLGEEE